MEVNQHSGIKCLGSFSTPILSFELSACSLTVNNLYKVQQINISKRVVRIQLSFVDLCASQSDN